jgi:hypothetical protein
MRMFKEVKPIIDYEVRNLCFRSYPGHPKGCPNFGKRPSCPPKAPILSMVMDLDQPVYAIWNVFDFGRHTQRMNVVHPGWSRRQLECCLYWQGTARKQLQAEINQFLSEMDGLWTVIKCPEALGVNVTETMKSIGEHLEWPPVTKTYQVALAGIIIHP